MSDTTGSKHIYFVGIGGVSMSGLAQILRQRGYTVSGSDRAPSPLTLHLEEQGILVNYGQVRENITDDIDMAVLTAAIHPDNPEAVALREKGIPCLTRAELLGEIMTGYERSVGVAGTHGKTTTTSMLSQITMDADLDPTLSIGGNYAPAGGNLRIGASDLFVTEACEYTNSFLSLYPLVGIILDIDEDHLDFFKDLADIRRSFRRYAENIRPEGALILGDDIPDPEEITKGLACRVLTTGLDPNSDYYAEDPQVTEEGHYAFTIRRKDGSAVTPGLVRLKVPGLHNVRNAVAAAAAADCLDIPGEAILSGLNHFSGTDRRFQYKGVREGVTVVDDYAHHPTEIKATLTAAASLPHGKLYCVFQPHTYSRTKALLPEFAEALALADEVILAPIYAARETDTLGVSSESVAELIREKGVPSVSFDSFEEIAKYLVAKTTKNDLVLTMGAGNVDSVADLFLTA